MLTPDFDAIPVELKAHDQWGAFDKDKVPLNPETDRNADPKDPSTWTDYETAKDFYESSDRAVGLGFLFTEDDSLVGIDLNDCYDPEPARVADRLDDWAARAITILGPSYVEASPSNTGLHAIVKGEIPDCRNKNTDTGFEMYDSGRYFTVTGAQIEGSLDTIESKTDGELHDLHDTYLGADSEKADLSDVDVTIPNDAQPDESFENEYGVTLDEVREREPRIDLCLSKLEPNYETVGHENPNDESPSGYEFSLCGPLVVALRPPTNHRYLL